MIAAYDPKEIVCNFQAFESKVIQTLFLHELKWYTHAGQRMNERKIQKKWMAQAMVRGQHSKNKKGRYRCEYKGRTFIYRIDEEGKYNIITTWQ